MGRVYATSTQYQTYTGQAPTADTDRLLARASTMLETQVFRFCHYQADSVTGMPTDSLVLQAFADATCAQVEWWAAVGDTIGIGGIGTYDTVRIGTAHMQGVRTVGPNGLSAARQIAPGAWDALQQEDLTEHDHRFKLGVVTTW